MFFLMVGAGALAWEAWSGARPFALAGIPRAFGRAALAWIALCVVSLAWSIDPGYTLAELRREILYGALAFLVVFGATRTSREMHLFVAMLFLGALVLGVGEWLRFLLPGVQWARNVSMGPGPYSTQIVLLAPLLILLAWPRPVGLARGVRVTLALGAVLIVAGIAGDSRILWVALMVCAVVASAAFWVETAPHHPGRPAVRRALVIALLLLPVLMVAATEYKLRYYPRAASTMDAFSLDERPLIWKTAVGMVRERPVLGHGYGREILGKRISAILASAKLGQAYFHGHNVILDTELQMGVPGVVAFVLLMLSLAAAFAAARKREGGAPLAIVGLALLAGYFTKSMTDDFFFRPSSLVFWGIAGMLLGLAARLPPKT